MLRAPVIRCKHSEDSILRQQGVRAHATERILRGGCAGTSCLGFDAHHTRDDACSAPQSESESCSTGRSFDAAEGVRSMMAVVGLTAAAAPFGCTAWLYCAQKR